MGALGRAAGADADADEAVLPQFDPGEAADALGYLARAFLLNPAGLQGSDAGPPIFRLKLPMPAKTKVEEAAVARLLNNLELATEVLEPAPGVTKLVCSAGGLDKPFITLEVSASRLDLVMDLAAARNSWAHVSELLKTVTLRKGVDLSGLEVKTLQGVLSVGVSAPSPDRFIVSADLQRDFHFEGALGAGPVELKLAASKPMLSMENDAGGSGKIQLRLGKLSLKVPFAEEDEQATYELTAAALWADLETSLGDQPITLKNLSLGKASAVLYRDEEELAVADLNAATERKISLGLRPAEDGSVTLELLNALDVGVEWNAESWAVKAPKGAQLRLGAETEEGDELFEVLAGEVKVSVTGAAPVTAGPGQFLVGLDEDEGRDDEAHPLLRLLTVR